MTYGHHDVSFRPMTLSFSEVLDRETCINFWGGDDSYSIYYQNGQITHEVIGAAQIDKYGDVNNIAGTSPINALIKAVITSEVTISLIFIGDINKFVKFLLQISSRKSILNPMLVLNKKS